GYLWAGHEQCDDGNLVGHDGCETTCQPTWIERMDTTGSHTCAQFVDGALRCWGVNNYGQLGRGDTINTQGQSPHAVPVIPVGGPVEQLALSSAFMCALLQSGAVRCWGRFGGYGYGNLDNIGDQPGEMPPPDIDLGGTVLGLSSGSAHTCALMAGGSVRCWGANSWGELGLGHTNTIGDQPGEMPPPIVDLGGPVAQLSLASQGACALMETGTVRCWGRYGMFSYGNNLDLGNEPGEIPTP